MNWQWEGALVVAIHGNVEQGTLTVNGEVLPPFDRPGCEARNAYKSLLKKPRNKVY